jgi:S-adenosylmethionine decarboxylase proenzyme
MVPGSPTEAYALDTNSRHLLVEYHGCDTQLLNEASRLEDLLRRAAEAAGATVVTSTFHRFCPQGVSGVVVVEESHLSIHTWPEVGYAAADFYTCGDCEPIRAHELLRDGLGAARSEVMTMRRGLYPPAPSIRVESHYREEAARTTSFVEPARPRQVQ